MNQPEQEFSAPFSIVDEQQDFIIVDKAANVNFHDEGEIGAGLFNQVKAALGNNPLYPVHRLDKMTSGLIIFAKTLEAARYFEQIFSSHQIEKYYIAISENKPSKKQGLIKGDMSKSRRGMYKLLRTQTNPAITQFFSYSIGQGKRLYLLKPHSGKTHQIRVALNSIAAPILGDALYNTNIATKAGSKINTDRGYLHAYALVFDFDDKCYQYCVAPSTGDEFLQPNVIEQLQSLTKPWLQTWPKVK
ncbi:TIGR01621 family pseudouridine synthase [Thalassotalea sp. PLHSN55]|uniref:TIGR01621 family pseudouridine synthase n=1 Tax=Thalassotalea sp. PLHSN55 TaxID=3435888 RepID=UPI003F82D7F4